MADERPARESLDVNSFMDRMENAVTSGTRSGRDAAVEAFRDLRPWQRAVFRAAASVTPGLANRYLNNKLGHGGPEDLRRIGVDDFVGDLAHRDPELARELRGERAAPDAPRPGDQRPAEAAGSVESAGSAGSAASGDQGGQPPSSVPRPDGRESGQAAMRAAFGDPVSPLTQVDPSAAPVSDAVAKKGAAPQRGTETHKG